MVPKGPQSLQRRYLTSGVAAAWFHLAAVAPAARAGGLEEVRKAASIIPGYGPPDVNYPAAFRGRWKVVRTVVDVQTPLGEKSAPAAVLERTRAALAGPPVSFEQRFIADPNGIISDRAFNTERRTAALSASAGSDLEARWDPSNPNVLTLATLSTGALVETKVTKRSFETPYDGAFGTSEYARVAE